MVVFSLLMVLYLLNSRINPTAKITWRSISSNFSSPREKYVTSVWSNTGWQLLLAI